MTWSQSWCTARSVSSSQNSTPFPPAVATALEHTLPALQKAGGANLQALVLYGSAARGEYRPNHSDINLLVVASRLSLNDLITAGGPLQRAWRRDRVRPYLIRHDERTRLADVFPLN